MEFDLSLIGRTNILFERDIENHNVELNEKLENSRILVIGAAGSIGAAVTKELFRRKPECLHAVDISENNLVSLVRNIRSTLGYTTGDFSTFCLDVGSTECDIFLQSQKKYDYVLNLSALKHVRSEKDPFTLMRMIKTNIFNSIRLHDYCALKSSEKYFCISSDKAANPENLMGATKRIMELFAFSKAETSPVSMARFANVAFSDGSLLHGFRERLYSRQPISAPLDIERYFITPKEAGQLCLMSALLCNSGEILFPSNVQEIKPIAFSEIATRYLRSQSLEPYLCESEEEARMFFNKKKTKDNLYPCYFFKTDTTGEKALEEFFTSKETIDLGRFEQAGIVQPDIDINKLELKKFKIQIDKMMNAFKLDKNEIIETIRILLPEMSYFDNGKYLDGKM